LAVVLVAVVVMHILMALALKGCRRCNHIHRGKVGSIRTYGRTLSTILDHQI
jgi:hypothetical protein